MSVLSPEGAAAAAAVAAVIGIGAWLVALRAGVVAALAAVAGVLTAVVVAWLAPAQDLTAAAAQVLAVGALVAVAPRRSVPSEAALGLVLALGAAWVDARSWLVVLVVPLLALRGGDARRRRFVAVTLLTVAVTGAVAAALLPGPAAWQAPSGATGVVSAPGLVAGVVALLAGLAGAAVEARRRTREAAVAETSTALAAQAPRPFEDAAGLSASWWAAQGGDGRRSGSAAAGAPRRRFAAVVLGAALVTGVCLVAGVGGVLLGSVTTDRAAADTARAAAVPGAGAEATAGAATEGAEGTEGGGTGPAQAPEDAAGSAPGPGGADPQASSAAPGGVPTGAGGACPPPSAPGDGSAPPPPSAVSAAAVELRGNPGIEICPAAGAVLDSVGVDGRLLAVLALLSEQWSFRVDGFDTGGGGVQLSGLQSQDGAPAAADAAVWLRAQQGAYAPSLVEVDGASTLRVGYGGVSAG